MRSISEKTMSRDEAAEFCRKARERGLRIGFTSGAYDLLHAGHADFLERARALCDLLVVAVNTDASVRRYKGPHRPIVPEEQRMRLVASLESVDCVFLFSERRNARNIEAIRPNYYIKAGDYSRSQLTSAEVVESVGGEAVLLDIRTPTSTTELIERACRSLGISRSAEAETDGAVELPMPAGKAAPAAFLDRDGTINVELEYLHDPERFELLPHAGEGMRRLMDMGYRIVVVTNQAGIGLGYFQKEDFYKVNRAMFRALKPYGVVIDRIYFCPHGLDSNCDCRKPRTALFERAVRDLNIDLANSFFVGDRTSDLEAARRMGIAKVLVRTGKAGEDGEFDVEPDFVAENLADVARWALECGRKADS